MMELNWVRADGWDGMGGSYPETDATIRVPAVRISTQGSKKCRRVNILTSYISALYQWYNISLLENYCWCVPYPILLYQTFCQTGGSFSSFCFQGLFVSVFCLSSFFFLQFSPQFFSTSTNICSRETSKSCCLSKWSWASDCVLPPNRGFARCKILGLLFTSLSASWFFSGTLGLNGGSLLDVIDLVSLLEAITGTDRCPVFWSCCCCLWYIVKSWLDDWVSWVLRSFWRTGKVSNIVAWMGIREKKRTFCGLIQHWYWNTSRLGLLYQPPLFKGATFQPISHVNNDKTKLLWHPCWAK